MRPAALLHALLVKFRSAAQGVLPVPDSGIICGVLALSLTINFPFCGVLSGGLKVT
jgi:hypothetical protein